MGAWNDHRPKVIACGCCCTGLILLIFASVVFATRKGEEVDVWYSVPLCQVSTSSYYVSRNPPSGATTLAASCATAGDPTVAQEITFAVEKSFFIAGASYTTFLMHTDNSDLSEASGTNVRVELVGLYNPVNTGAQARRLDEAEEPVGPRRRLLKGGFSSGSSYSGPSYRSRNGNFGYYGTRTYSRRYGRSGVSAVENDVIVSVMAPGPIFSTRSGTGYLSTSSADCQNSAKGCEFVVPVAMTKSELTAGKFTIPEDMNVESGTFTLKATAKVFYSNTTTTAVYPNLFVVFATDTTTPESIIGYIFIPLACCIILFGTACAISNDWDWCPNCGKRSSYHPVSHSGSTSNTGNPMMNTSANSRSPEVDMPMPHAPGPKLIRRNGSFRNLRDVGSQSTVDLTSNDISGLQAGRQLPTKNLIVVDNDLYSLNGIEHSCQELVSLDVRGNDLRDLTGLSLPNLKWLNVANNNLTNLGGSHGCPMLLYLNAADNDLKNLAGVTAFPALTNLDVGNNDITTVHGLAAACPNLQKVNLAQNEIIDPEPLVELVNLPGMRFLNISGHNMRAAQLAPIMEAAEAKPDFVLRR